MNADMTPTGVTVHMRLDKLESSIFINIVLECAEFLAFDGTIINWSYIVSYPTHMMIASSV